MSSIFAIFGKKKTLDKKKSNQEITGDKITAGNADLRDTRDVY